MLWIEEIVEAMTALDGAARLDDLYYYVENNSSRDLSPSWKSIIRRTLGDYSSDSEHFTYDDLFANASYGHWRLRSVEVEESDLAERSKLTPEQAVQKVLVRSHFRTRPARVENSPLFHMISDGPRPVAPFSHAVETNGFIFVTGQMPTDPAPPDAPLPMGVEAQTHGVVENLKIVLGGVGLDLSHILMARIYLTDFYGDYDAMNEVWQSYFPTDRRPARTTVGVTGLALHALVEIDLVCKRPDDA